MLGLDFLISIFLTTGFTFFLTYSRFPRVESVNNEVFAPDDMADFEARRARTQLFDATIAGSINEDRDRNTENQQQLNQYQVNGTSLYVCILICDD